MRAWAAPAAVILIFAACDRPAVVSTFRSPWGDFEAEIPKSWSVKTSDEGDVQRLVALVGPRDSEAAFGAPRLVVAWYANGRTFTAAGGKQASFSGSEDYVRTMERTAWSRTRQYLNPPRDLTFGTRAGRRLDVRAHADGYVLLPNTERADETVVRRDAVVLVETKGGFYAVTYPGVEPSYAKTERVFEHFLATLRFLKDSPVD